MAAIEMKNIVKKYGDGFPAVNDISLDIADGEFMILVGPSGCGKSTLLRMIVGLEDISSGDMLIGGKRVNDKAPRDRNLSMVFQNYALYPHLTVYENIAFPLRLAKMDDGEVKKRVTEAADVLELHEHLERKPANLSGGQRQRSSARPRRSCSTSRCPTSTPSCAGRCAPRSPGCSAGSASPRST
jgi:multiple sugar transport system ATP-binding protein